MAASLSHSQSLLPGSSILVLDRIERDSDSIRLMVHVEQEPRCPVCDSVSRSGHSCYRRHLQDLPWQGASVQLWITVGRFRCRNSACPRRIFCERLPHVAQVYGRQTTRASEIVRVVGYVAGGLPGQRLLARLSVTTSDDTVLRRVRQNPVPIPSQLPVHNLGVDDWAWRKQQSYGTILVDLDLRRVIDLLPDRTSESFAEWLRQHPEVVTISRDRCGLYAEGADLGAPQAQQVADRFHLILNLSATMERVLEERSRQLVLPPVEDPSLDSTPAKTCEESTDPPEPEPVRLTQSQLRRQRRLERYQQVVELFNAGESQAAISRTLGMERKTVRRWLRRGEFPERKPPHRPPPKVNQFADYLQQRWNEAVTTRRAFTARSGKEVMRANAPCWHGWFPVGGLLANPFPPRLRRESRPNTPRFSSHALPTKSQFSSKNFWTASWSSARTSTICGISRWRFVRL